MPKKQVYNKGSDRLPISERGPANHRHFAREIAKLGRVDVECDWSGVYILSHYKERMGEVYDIAARYDMVDCTLNTSVPSFAHESIIE